jgi:hypothetical protein
MNKVEIGHHDLVDGCYVLGGGDVYINGQQIKGVLELTPNHLCKHDDVASVTITLAVNSFSFGSIPK